jgi:hypothetical protein
MYVFLHVVLLEFLCRISGKSFSTGLCFTSLLQQQFKRNKRLNSQGHTIKYYSSQIFILCSCAYTCIFFFLWRMGNSCMFSFRIDLELWTLRTVGTTPWSGDQPVARPLATQGKTHTEKTQSRIRNHDPRVRVGEGTLCLRPRGHWDRPALLLYTIIQTEFVCMCMINLHIMSPLRNSNGPLILYRSILLHCVHLWYI